MFLSDEDRAWFEKVRSEWLERIKPFSTARGDHVFHTAQPIPQAALDRAKVYSNRYHALSQISPALTVAEIGTQTGDFAKFIMNSLKPEKIVCFDIYDEDVRRSNPTLFDSTNFQLIVGDSSVELARFPDEFFDVIYIDGDHSFEGVAKDVAVSTQKVKRSGVLVFNDYVMWSIRELTDYGIVPAVNGLLNTGEWRVEYIALEEMMYCDIALRRQA